MYSFLRQFSGTPAEPGEAPPSLLVAELVFCRQGEAEFARQLDRTLAEMRAEGCLHVAVWRRAGRRVLLAMHWVDADHAHDWLEGPFLREVLLPRLRRWCVEIRFGEYALRDGSHRARRCRSCGVWSEARPGWDERRPARCRRCDAPLTQVEAREGVHAA